MRSSSGQVKPRAHLVRATPWAPVVDPDDDRLAIGWIGDRQGCPDRPRTCGRGIAVRDEAFTAGGPSAQGIEAC